MNRSYFTQLFFHGLVGLLVSAAVIAWLAQAWKTNPNARVARWTVGNRRIWLPIALAVLPPILTLFVGGPLFRLFATVPWHPGGMVALYALSIFNSALQGMAAASCASPVDVQGRARLAAPVAISAALVFLPSILFWHGPFQPYFVLAEHVVLAAIIIVAARLLLGDREAPVAPDPAAPSLAPKSSSLALLIGFAPSALALAVLPIGAALHLSRSESDSLLWMLCVVSIVCCFVASGMLFARRTGGAVLGGILFLLLNGFVAFFFGCCASLKF